MRSLHKIANYRLLSTLAAADSSADPPAKPHPSPLMVPQPAIAPDRPRLYCPELPHPRLGEASCVLDPEQTRHLRKALRLGPGAAIELFDGRGGLARATVEQFEGQYARCRIQAVNWHERTLPQLIVATAIPKGPRGEDMIEQLSQLGVDRVVPLKTQRSVVHPRPQKVERFEKAAVESAKQSGRLFLLELAALHTLEELLAEPAGLTLALATGGEAAEPDREAVRHCQSLRLVVGPEGGFTDEELDRMQAAGAQPWTIGPTVLRIETAAVAAAAIGRFLAIT
jgi:16S rRNA (uracil1498-N3)-methyltransferase